MFPVVLNFHRECWNPVKKHSKALVFFAVSKQIPVVYSTDRGRAEIITVVIIFAGTNREIPVPNFEGQNQNCLLVFIIIWANIETHAPGSFFFRLQHGHSKIKYKKKHATNAKDMLIPTFTRTAFPPDSERWEFSYRLSNFFFYRAISDYLVILFCRVAAQNVSWYIGNHIV